MSDEILKNLGPLAKLAGTWEGSKGDDVAPADDRTKTENNKFRERMTFVPMGPTNNHDQVIYSLEYTTTAWRLGETEPFHKEVGYWHWDAKAKQVMKSFLVPRGMTILAGGTAEPDAKQFEMAADLGSSTCGVCSNKYLDMEFQTVRFELKVTFHADGSFSYEEDTQLKIKGQSAIFHHRDKNTLRLV